MKRMLSKSVVLAVVVAVFELTQAVSAPPQWSITDLGTLPGGTRSSAFGINDHGQAVGYSGQRLGANRTIAPERRQGPSEPGIGGGAETARSPGCKIRR